VIAFHDHSFVRLGQDGIIPHRAYHKWISGGYFLGLKKDNGSANCPFLELA
jgi:hypothetical protein